MGLCLTPMAWSPYPARREAPFQAPPENDRWNRELIERGAVWEVWHAELGGRVFVEPPTGRKYRLFVRRYGRREAIMILEDRWEAIDLRDEMLRAGFDAELE